MNKGKRLKYIFIIILFFYLQIGYYPDRCGCEFKFYFIPYSRLIEIFKPRSEVCETFCSHRTPLTYDQWFINKLLLKSTKYR